MPPKQNESFDYAKMTVVQLKALLKEKGISVYGLKAELVKRLKDAALKDATEKIQVPQKKITVEDLRNELRRKNLSTIGRKADLVARLEQSNNKKDYIFSNPVILLQSISNKIYDEECYVSH